MRRQQPQGELPEFVEKLRKAIPSLWVWDDLESRLSFATDRSTIHAVPDLVVLPATEEELLQFMELARLRPFPLTPQGARTGTTGGAVPYHRGIAISLLRMNHIRSIDPHNRAAVVEPGLITGHLHRTLEARGLFYPPDPASLHLCTLGGNISEDAGGPRAVKYGVTHDYILGLTVILPNGKRLRLGGPTHKDVAGYHLSNLFVGAEGTLGIITEAVVRILPLPPSRYLLLGLFPSVKAALSCVSDILLKETPSAIEFMDAQATRLMRPHLPTSLPDRVDSLLLIEMDGPDPSVKAQLDIIQQICHKNAAIDLLLARNQAEADKLWEIRRNLSPALYSIAPTKLNHDVVVPLKNIMHLIDTLEDLSTRLNLPIATFGHVGDGNLHVNIMTDKSNTNAYQRAMEGVETLFREVIDLNGSISGEHGIGLTKRAYLPLQLSGPTLDAMKQIKRTFDPRGILNPGKIFT